MKKQALWILLCVLALLAGGCGEQPKSADTPAMTAAPAAPAATPGISGAFADAARKLMDAYQQPLTAAAERQPNLLTYRIPGDMIGKMAQDAADTGAQPQEGRYVFTSRQSGEYTYSAKASEIEAIEIAAETTPDPRTTDDPVMDNQQMGDFTAAGGGVFDRSCAYNVAEGLTDGTAEITDILNGAVTGHELFSFTVENGQLYFVDAMLDQAVDMDGLVSTDRYLVAAGVLRGDGLEIIEFSVPGKEQVPAASAASVKQLLSGADAISRITVKGNQVTTDP